MEKKILKLLNHHQGEYISIQHISEQLHITNQEVISYITQFKQKGYNILSKKNLYCFTNDNDVIFIDEIKQQINSFYQNITFFDSIDSTNIYMKTHDCHEGDIVIADAQTHGKGRNGKHFYSPKQKGIYLSFKLKPHFTIHDSLKITACCGVALIKAIQKNYPLTPMIKWVNDIMINDKKVAGILCEASLQVNTNMIEHMIVGVGINVHHTPMPNELKKIATSLEDESDIFIPRQKIIIDFLNFFYDDYSNLSNLSFLDTYRKHSYVLHQNILVYENNNSYLAYVKDINDDGTLTIITNHQEKILQSGEISIRKTNSQQHT